MKFIEDIEKDINAYTKILELNSSSEARKCVKQIEFVYGKRVDGLNGLYRNSVWDGDADWIDLLRNAIRIIGFYREEYAMKSAHNSNLGVNSLNKSDKVLTLDMGITDYVSVVKESLEGTISDQAYNEVVEKLDELQEIAKEQLSLGKKWIRTKGILEWLQTTGVDVFVLIIPIIYKILTDEE